MQHLLLCMQYILDAPQRSVVPGTAHELEIYEVALNRQTSDMILLSVRE